MTFELKRIGGVDAGTTGVLYTANFSLCTIELPWRYNIVDRSCIPAGTYSVVPHYSPTFGDVYLITGVKDRDEILIHEMNWAGDIVLGYKSDSEGCIGVGLYHDTIGGQLAVAQSVKALKRLKEFVGKKEFTLKIDNYYLRNMDAKPVMNVL